MFRKENKKYLALVVGILLLAGGLFYYLFSPQTFFVKVLDRFIGEDLRRPFAVTSLLGRLIRNYGLDCLWACAFSFAISLYCQKNRNVVLIVTIPIITGSILEFFQKINVFNGTADVLDIFAESLGTIVTALILGGIGHEKT